MGRKTGLIALVFLAFALMPCVGLAINPEDFWYKANGDALDSGLYGHNLTPGGTSAYQPGKLGQAFYFDGLTTSVLHHASDSHYDLGTEFSISFWLYTNTDTNYIMPMSREDTGGWQVELQPTASGGDTNFYQRGYSASGSLNVRNLTWNLIIIQREGDGNTHIYVNNVLDVQTADAKTYNVAKDFHVGAGRGGTLYPMMTGSMVDDIRIYNNVSLNSTHRDTLWNGGAGTNLSLNYSAPVTYFDINITAPNGTYHNVTMNATGIVAGINATYLCWYSVNGTNSSNFSVTNNTNFSVALPTILNGTHSFFIECTNGSITYNRTTTFYIDVGKIDLYTWNEATNNYTQANITQILVYNSSSNVNFTGNNFSWAYTDLPGGNITIIAFFNNITRETSTINNATNYLNVTLSFPSLTGNYYFLVHNIYNNPLENVLVTFSELDGTYITSRYSQSDGYVYDIFLTLNVPVTITLSKTGYITKTMTFTPYIDTILPVRIPLLVFYANGTEFTPFANISYSCTPNLIIVDNATLITCTLQESNSAMLTSIMNVYYMNYSGSYLSKATTCLNPGSCTFTFTTNKTGAKFRFNLTLNMTYANYTYSRDYYTNATGDYSLADSSGFDKTTWQFIFFVLILIFVALTWGYFGALSLLIIPVIFGIGVFYHVFDIGQFILLLLVTFIMFMKMV